MRPDEHYEWIAAERAEIRRRLNGAAGYAGASGTNGESAPDLGDSFSDSELFLRCFFRRK